MPRLIGACGAHRTSNLVLKQEMRKKFCYLLSETYQVLQNAAFCSLVLLLTMLVGIRKLDNLSFGGWLPTPGLSNLGGSQNLPILRVSLTLDAVRSTPFNTTLGIWSYVT